MKTIGLFGRNVSLRSRLYVASSQNLKSIRKWNNKSFTTTTTNEATTIVEEPASLKWKILGFASFAGFMGLSAFSYVLVTDREALYYYNEKVPFLVRRLGSVNSLLKTMLLI